MDSRQYCLYIVDPALGFLAERFGVPDTLAARQLIVSTILWESNGLTFIRQRYRDESGKMADGRARGFPQIEPATYDTVCKWAARRMVPGVRQSLLELLGGRDITRLYTDQAHAVHICRLIYWRVPEALPAAGDWPGLWSYWARYYNTRNDQATRVPWVRRARLGWGHVTEGQA